MFFSCANACAFGAWSWSGKTGDVVLTEDATVLAADVATVAALTGIEIPEGITLTVTNGATSFNLSAKLTGNGTFKSTAAAVFTISGDNSGYTGAMTFAGDDKSASVVTVTSRHGLGAPKMKDGATRRFIRSSCPTLRLSGDALTCDVGIYWDRGRSSSDTFTALSDAAVFDAPVYTDHSGWVQELALGNWTLNAGFGVSRTDTNPLFNLSTGIKAYVNSERFTTGGTYARVCLQSQSELHLNTPNKGPTGGHLMFYGAGKLVCDCADALKNGSVIYLGWNSDKSGTLDLNGFSQTLPSVRHASCSGWAWNPTEGESAYVTITSATPATVTMTDNASWTLAARIRGAASVEKAGTGTLKLVNQTSDTTGTLKITKGAVELDWSAVWLGDVDVGAAGRLILDRKSRLGDATSHVTVADGGKIQLDGTFCCAALTLGATAIAPGTVVEAADYPAYLEGSGLIYVAKPLAGDVFTWNGSGTDWSTATCWTPNGVPGDGDKIVFPANAKVYLTDAAKTVAEAVSAIQLDAGSTLFLSNTTVTVSIKADLSGTGSITSSSLEKKNPIPTKTIEFKGLNLAYSGHMEFLKAPVLVSSRHALGNPVRTVYAREIQGYPFRFQGDGLTNDVPITTCGQVLDTGDTYTASYGDPWVQRGLIDYYQPSDCPTIRLGAYTFCGGWKQTTSSPVFEIQENRTLTVRDRPIDFAGSGGGWQTFNILSGATVLLDVTNNVWDSKFGIVGAGSLKCGVTNALCASSRLNMAYASTTANLDLNGCDQTVSGLCICQGPSWSHGWGSGPTAKSTGYGKITSAAAATLTLQGSSDLLAPILFTGAVSVRKVGTYTQTIVNKFSDSTGTLTVTNGTMAFKWNAGWKGDVVLSHAGKLSVLDDTVTLDKDGLSNVAISGNGKIAVVSGASLTVNSVTLGETAVPDDVYTKDNCTWIEGDGSVIVRKRNLWTGKGATKAWSDAGNWTDGVPTATSHVVIPAGYTVTATNADVAVLSVLTDLKIGGSLTCLNDKTALTLAADLTGDGTIVVGKGVSVTFAGDNVAYTGSMTFNTANVYVTSRTGLGAPKMLDGTTQRWIYSNAGLLRFRGDGLTCDVGIRWYGHRNTAASAFTDAWTDEMTFNGPVQMNKSGNVDSLGMGNYTFNAGCGVNGGNGTPNFQTMSNCKSRFVGETSFYGGSSYMQTEIQAGGEMHLAAPGSTITGGYLVFYGYGTVVCDVENALPTKQNTGLGRSSNPSGTIDLNGYNQTTPAFGHSFRSGWVWTPKQGEGNWVFVKNSGAAPATIRTTGSYSTAMNAWFRDTAGFTKAAAGTNTFANFFSDTTGTLTATNKGAVAFKWGAGWAGPIRIEKDSAVVFSDTPAVAKAQSSYNIKNTRTGAVTVAAGGELHIAAGAKVKLASLTLGATEVPAGTYTPAQLNALAGATYVTGTGTLRVGRAGLAVFLR